ncbi:MAG: ATP-binding protein [Actinomycetota bacterium]|nr:ATP-binding protein [Actinomycetota bacterium]
MSVAHPSPAVVELRLPARAALIPTVRTVASDLAGRADLDLDAIDDLRMAVDEACTTLVRLTTEEDTLTCIFTLTHDGIEVSVRTRAAWAGAKVSTDSFGWRVLQTLADEVEARAGDADDPDSIGIALVKHAIIVQ